MRVEVQISSMRWQPMAELKFDLRYLIDSFSVVLSIDHLGKILFTQVFCIDGVSNSNPKFNFQYSLNKFYCRRLDAVFEWMSI